MATNYDVITSGYCSLDHIIRIDQPMRIGQTSIINNADASDVAYGGCSVNVSVLLAKLGINVLPILRVGDDYKETGFESFLMKNDVQRDAIRIISGEKTSFSYLIQDSSLDHVTLFHPGAMHEAYAEKLTDDWFKRSKIALMTVAGKADNEIFLDHCKDAKLPLAFGMKQDETAFPKQFLKEVIDYSTIIFANEAEEKVIKELYATTAITELFQKTKLERIIITLGKNGVRSYLRKEDNRQFDVPALNVETIADTVGAGDAFVAGYLYAYRNNLSHQRALEYGNTMASFIIEGHGCTSNSPSLNRLNERCLRYEEDKT